MSGKKDDGKQRIWQVIYTRERKDFPPTSIMMRRGAWGILPLRGTRLAQAHVQMFLLVSIVDETALAFAESHNAELTVMEEGAYYEDTCFEWKSQAG